MWGRRLLLAGVILVIIAVIHTVWLQLSGGSDRFTIEQTRRLASSVDGMEYRVHEGHTSPQKAADTLANLNAQVIGIMRSLRARYIRGPLGNQYPERRAAVQQLLARYNPDNLAENSPHDPSGDTAYTLDKGALVAICLRAESGEKIHDNDTLMFVTIHEMAHIAIKDIDHPKRFWSAFRFLLEEAEIAGIHTDMDYARFPRKYCGVRVDSNPRHDPNVVSL